MEGELPTWTRTKAVLFVGNIGRDGIDSINILQAYIPFCQTCLMKTLCTDYSLLSSPCPSSEYHAEPVQTWQGLRFSQSSMQMPAMNLGGHLWGKDAGTDLFSSNI
jgi:hypothetical protein